MTAHLLLDELRARGGAAYRHGERVRIVPPSAVSPDLLRRLREHRHELLEVLPEAPPEVAALPAIGGPWIISSSSDGAMRLLVETPPPWPDSVFEAATLVEVIDHHHRAGRDSEASRLAERLEAALGMLRAAGVSAWLAS